MKIYLLTEEYLTYPETQKENIWEHSKDNLKAYNQKKDALAHLYHIVAYWVKHSSVNVSVTPLNEGNTFAIKDLAIINETDCIKERIIRIEEIDFI